MRLFFGVLCLLLVALSLGLQIGMQMERRRSDVHLRQLEAKFALSGSGVTFEEDPEKEVDLSLMWTVWRLLDQYYVEPSDLVIDSMRYGAVRGLVQSLEDPYTSFMTPKESTDFSQVLQGTLEGIGAELTMRDGRVVVVAPIRKTPAARAGLLPQDIILAVDDFSLEGVSLEDAVNRIRGPKGTEVVLKVYRTSTDEELLISITRDTIRVPSTEFEIIETASGSVGYLAINQFGQRTTVEARAAIQQIRDADLQGAILDLRFNGGGFLEGSVEIGSLFLHKGKMVSVHRRGQEVESLYVNGDVLLPDLPLVVIINEGSASASEIVAGALRDHGRASLLGAQSFGKGTVQEVIDLPGGSSLRVTVAQWKTPQGEVLSHEGIKPDLTVPMNMEDYLNEYDPQKDAAVAYLLGGSIEDFVRDEEEGGVEDVEEIEEERM